MCLVAMEITYLWPNRPPGLINTRFHTKISHHQKDWDNPCGVNHFCNLYGAHLCRLQCITCWPFWLWIMAVNLIVSPFNIFHASLRNLGMGAWARTLKLCKVFTKVGWGPWLKRKLCLGPASVINCTALSTLSFWVSLLPGAFDYNKSITPKNLFTIVVPTKMTF